MIDAINLCLKEGFEMITNYSPYNKEPKNSSFKKKLSN